MEGPDPEMQQPGQRKERSWDVIREWFRSQKAGGAAHPNDRAAELRLLLSVLGCPLAPIPLAALPHHPLRLPCSIPIQNSMAHYILKQYLAATGCFHPHRRRTPVANMYAAGRVKMACCETEVSSGKSVKSGGATRPTPHHGSFVLWQMTPALWSVELALVAGGPANSNPHSNDDFSHYVPTVNDNKVVAGSDGKIVWRHTPWLGTHAARGPHRPLRRLIQGLDPESTARLFGKAQCMGERSIGEEECFVLKVAAEREAVMERSEGGAEVLRHVLHGYFSQKSGLLIYLEDSHLVRVHRVPTSNNPSEDSELEDQERHHDEEPASPGETVYWETTIGSSIGDYREVDGLMIAHEGKSIATVFRFGETSMQYRRTRMEEAWTIHDIDFNVPGLSLDHFIPPSDIHIPSP